MSPQRPFSASVYIRPCGKFHVGRSVLFPDVFADIRILAKTSATGGQRGTIFPGIRSIRKPIRIIGSPAQYGCVLDTGFVDSSTLIQLPFLELYLL